MLVIKSKSYRAKVRGYMKEEYRQKLCELNCCVIIPTYNNAKTLPKVIDEVKAYAQHMIIVNDGSTDTTSEIIQSIQDITVCSYPENKGKGFALQTGFKKALEKGFDYAITIDSDGQHFPSDIPLFAAKAAENPGSIIVGARNLEQENMPGKNTFANKFSNFWFWVETGEKLSDTQSGFRLYPIKKLSGIRFYSKKYEFELEVLVRSQWKGIPVISIPIQVFYAPEGERVSHFKPLRDFTRISILNTVLVTIALLWVKPFSFIKNLNKSTIRKFINEQILSSKDSNKVITLSVMLGIFMGIVPVWGYQMIIAFALAHLFKLNKVITLVASNISIPPMIPFILFGSFATGAWILGNPLKISVHNITFETVKQDLFQYIVGSFALAAFSALTLGLVCAVLLVVFRKKGKV